MNKRPALAGRLFILSTFSAGKLRLMKCVILAAGEGTRMRPLTNDKPKPLVFSEIRQQTLIDLIIEALPTQVDELILVVGYLFDKIFARFSHQYTHPKTGRNFRVKYAYQQKAEGTYKALELCRPFLSEGEKFLMLYADDVYESRPLSDLAHRNELGMVTATVQDPTRFGILEVEGGYVTGIEEKPKNPKTNIASTGAMVLDTRVFEYKPPLGAKNEYVLADSVGLMIKAGIKFREIRAKAGEWLPVGYPDDLKKLERRARPRTSSTSRGELPLLRA